MSDSKQDTKHDEKLNDKGKKVVIDDQTKDDTSIEKNKEQVPAEASAETEQAEQTKWTPVWDDNAQAYYWWNTETNETTWINPGAPGEGEVSAATTTTSSNPLDFLLDRIDNVVKKKLDGGQEDENTPYYDNYTSNTTTTTASYDSYYDPNANASDAYTSQAHFNARTGRFTTQADVNRLNPDMLTIEARATRQMQNYFDVDSYTEERNAQIHNAENGRINKKKPLTRKEVEYFKKMKKEKKSKRAREWLLQ